MDRSVRFRSAVVEEVFAEVLDVENAAMALQRHDTQHGGYTDLEIQVGQSLHAIFEAKRWWDVPSVAQLSNIPPGSLRGVRNGGDLCP